GGSSSIAGVGGGRLDGRPDELLCDEVHLVGRPRAREHPERLRTVRVEVAPESVDGPVERFVPAGGSEHAIVTDKRLGESRVFIRTCLRHGIIKLTYCTDS